MYQRMEFCPKCNGTRRMVVSLGLMPIDPGKDLEDLLLFHLHCASCNSYVRSISSELEDPFLPAVMTVYSTPAYI